MARRLLLDVMLGRLASYLRMCGYDTVYALDRDVEADDALRTIAEQEGRTLVTRDVSLAAQVPESILLREREVTDQLRELQTAGLALELEAPTYCGRCNGALAESSPETPPEYVPDGVSTLWLCVDCGQYFWKGSHWKRVGETLQSL
ncbi:Mut7-C RNAse domain-containing protein [Haladaptatus sp. ZSTT2]|uniref:Mut7-C RNAse domain-containing protein n=1 Tax=Haladaptatus sp. ZSTT2 TaxID=3120515 RepID=UPI00300E7489